MRISWVSESRQGKDDLMQSEIYTMDELERILKDPDTASDSVLLHVDGLKHSYNIQYGY